MTIDNKTAFASKYGYAIENPRKIILKPHICTYLMFDFS